MSPCEMLTEGDERRIAREIIEILLKHGASYNQSVRILKDAKKGIGDIPFTE